MKLTNFPKAQSQNLSQNTCSRPQFMLSILYYAASTKPLMATPVHRDFLFVCFYFKTGCWYLYPDKSWKTPSILFLLLSHLPFAVSRNSWSKHMTHNSTDKSTDISVGKRKGDKQVCKSLTLLMVYYPTITFCAFFFSGGITGRSVHAMVCVSESIAD